MKKILKRLRRRIDSNSGAASTIEFIFIIMFLFIFMMSVIDLGIYFSDRNTITNTAQNGARLVSIYGGSSNTTISKAYGLSKITPECNKVNANGPAACGMIQQLENQGSSTIDLQVKSARCYVNPANSQEEKTDVDKLSDRPTCTITWEYPGLPGSALTIFSSLRNKNNISTTTTETANAEVIKDGSN